MSVLKNIIVQGLLATAVAAMPLAPEEPSTDVGNQEAINTVWAPTLAARKNTDKCEAHIAIDSSNGLCGAHCTQKYKIDIVDKAGQAIGKTYDWSQVGQWGATNPPKKVEIATTKNKNLWLDGYLPGGIMTNDDKWRSSFTLSYDTQVWSSHECANHKYKAPAVSNGHRHQFDLWCEFDC
ncbi:hypothetical protein PG993_008102 [Apiospora rasikravindrae]|uniref:Secreted protein n=1 Tax=Apiospora rasikravindrae TaxID=990691 RepID=A0ABR1SZD8_9PEZI